MIGLEKYFPLRDNPTHIATHLRNLDLIDLAGRLAKHDTPGPVDDSDLEYVGGCAITASYIRDNINATSFTWTPANNNEARANVENIVALFGTDELSDWGTNFRAMPWRGAGYWWHKGFLRYAEKLYDFCMDMRAGTVIGHSLGGAATQILAISLPQARCWAYAAPRVKIGGGFVEGEGRCVVFNRPDDLVTRVPPRYPVPFRHLGQVVEMPWSMAFGRGDHSIGVYRESWETHLGYRLATYRDYRDNAREPADGA